MPSKAPPAKSPEDLEEKRKACMSLTMARWIIKRPEKVMFLSPEESHELVVAMIADLHEHDCWGNFVPYKDLLQIDNSLRTELIDPIKEIPFSLGPEPDGVG